MSMDTNNLLQAWHMFECFAEGGDLKHAKRLPPDKLENEDQDWHQYFIEQKNKDKNKLVCYVNCFMIEQFLKKMKDPSASDAVYQDDVKNELYSYAVVFQYDEKSAYWKYDSDSVFQLTAGALMACKSPPLHAEEWLDKREKCEETLKKDNLKKFFLMMLNPIKNKRQNNSMSGFNI